MNEIPLYPEERLDDLLTHHLRIIQSEEVFSFSMDAVLLARFCSVPQRGRVLDLCAGNGVIPLLLTTRTKAFIDGVEIQPRLYHMAERSVALNGLGDRIHMRLGDLRTIHETLGFGKYDLVTVNPPYLSAASGEKNANMHFALARHEIACTLDDVVKACARLVKSGGKVAMVHRPSRLVEMITLLRAARLEPKRLRFVHPRSGEEANMVLIECIRDGGVELRLLPPLIVYGQDGQFTAELKQIYDGERTSL